MNCHRGLEVETNFSEGLRLTCKVAEDCKEWCEYGLSRYNTYIVKVEKGKRIVTPFGEPSHVEGGTEGK